MPALTAMDIQEIQIEGFGSLVDRTLNFSPGLNLVLGANEAGKTTLVECLAAIPYGFRPSPGQRERWRPWKGRAYAAKLTLKLADASVVTIRRDFDTNKADYLQVDSLGRPLEELTELKATPTARTPEARAFRDKIQALFGIASEQAFRQSICVSYQDLAELVGKPLSVLLRQAVTGARVNYENITEVLRARLNEITKEYMSGRPSDKKLEKLRSQQLHLEQQLEAFEKDYKELERLRLEIRDLDQQVIALKTELVQIDDTLSKIKAYRRCADEINRWSEKRELLAKRRRTLEEIGGKRTALDAYRDIQALPDDFETRLAQAERQQELVTRLDREKEEREELTRAMHIIPIWRRPAFLGLVGASLVAAGLVSLWSWQVGAGLGLAILLGLGFAFWQSLMQRSALSAAGLQLDAIGREHDAVQAELDSRLAEMRGFLPEFSLDQGVETLTRWKQYRGLTHDIELLTGQIEEGVRLKLVRQQLKEAEDKLGTLALEKQKREADAGYLKTITPDFEINKGHELDATKRRLEEAQDRLNRTSLQQAELAARVGSQEQIEETLEQVSAQISQCEFRRDAYKAALDGWQESIEEFRSDYMPHFANVVSRHFQTITRDRYSRMTFDREELSPTVEGREGEKVKEDFLSQGTKDELYFAIRLALVELFSRQQEPLPLILDDPFLTFDSDRRQQALAAIQRIAANTQVIILTLDESLRDCGGKVIELAI